VHLLLGLVVVLLATVPVLIPLVWTKSTVTAEPEALRLTPSAGVPAATGGVPAPGRPTATGTPPAGAGALAAPAPATTSPSPTPPEPTTTAPRPHPTTPADRDPAPTADPTTPEPDPTGAPRVLAAGSDLVVASVGWTPAPPGAGQPVVFSAVVRNIGSDPTPAVDDGVAFSVDGSEVTWSATGSDPLGPGEERTYVADDGVAGNAWTATSGDHTVEAQVDDQGRIPEISDDNNTATAGLTVP
jgi:hypothetical protein